MDPIQIILGEFDRETANLRRTLERVPDGKYDFKPHPKSASMGWLANHLVQMVTWVGITFNSDSFDLEPPGGDSNPRKLVDNTKDLLAKFDKNLTEARAAIAAATPADLGQSWALLKGGEQIFAMPKGAVLRSFYMNHMIHHRAQLTVYLRLNDVPVPALYGPSADEAAF